MRIADDHLIMLDLREKCDGSSLINPLSQCRVATPLDTFREHDRHLERYLPGQEETTGGLNP